MRRALLPAAVLLIPFTLPRASGAQQLEFTIDRVDPVSSTVFATDASGQQLQFHLPPKAFVGKRFDADLSPSGQGERFSARGEPNAQLTGESPRGFRGGGPPSRPQRPSREDRGPAAAAQQEDLEYQITQVDGTPDGFRVIARGKAGRQIVFLVHADVWRGYRFTVDAEKLRGGGTFDLTAPNASDLRNCCTLISGG